MGILRNIFTLICLLNSIESILQYIVFLDKWVIIKTKRETKILRY